MTEKVTFLTKASARLALREKGMNASLDAVEELVYQCDGWLRKVAEEATAIAESNHRKTILDRDVRLALVRVRECI